jgi:hypothetical protein
VAVRVNGVLDAQATGARATEVGVDVAARVEHQGPSARLVAHEVRGVTQALQIELLEEHLHGLPRGANKVFEDPRAVDAIGLDVSFKAAQTLG